MDDNRAIAELTGIWGECNCPECGGCGQVRVCDGSEDGHAEECYCDAGMIPCPPDFLHDPAAAWMLLEWARKKYGTVTVTNMCDVTLNGKSFHYISDDTTDPAHDMQRTLASAVLAAGKEKG